MFVSEKIMDFLSVADDSLYVLTHRTGDEDVGHHIIENGFEYTNSLHSTTDEMINDEVHVNYWIKHRQHYGNITIVICIDRKIFNKYVNLSKSNKLDIEIVISEMPLDINEEGDIIFLLSKHYIKGFFNNETEETFYNPNFNPKYENRQYLKNINNV